jgi:membrane-bound lytic murein transglycosylase D
MRASQPASPLSFSQPLPVSPESLPAKPENNGLESLFPPSEADIPGKAQDLEDSCVDLLGPAPREAISSLPIFLYEEIIQCQCQVSDIHPTSPSTGPSTEDNLLPLADARKAIASAKVSQALILTQSTPAQRESPAKKGAEVPFNRTPDWAKNTPSPLNLCEVSSPLKEDFALPEELSLNLFAWEYFEPQGTGRDYKPSVIISPNFPSLSHQKVEESIGFFQTRADAFFSRALGRSQAYEEMMKKILREKNLPEELFYLALIESGFNPHAFSRAKASGIWQFVGKTAKRFGLKVDKWVDERRDPEKSTYAAAAYLKSLYGMFNNWDLAAASYNAGEGKVLRAMKRANSQDFWEISQHRYLRKETKEYVPMFLAAVAIASEPQKYGFSNIDYHPPLLYEKVMVPPATRLDLIARAAETDLSEIKALNPALKKEKAPPNCAQFEIKLPFGKKAVFEKNFPLLSKKVASKSKKHSVRSGETLSAIAKKHRVPLKDLCQVNGLSPQARIKPGLILSVPR